MHHLIHLSSRVTQVLLCGSFKRLPLKRLLLWKSSNCIKLFVLTQRRGKPPEKCRKNNIVPGPHPYLVWWCSESTARGRRASPRSWPAAGVLLWASSSWSPPAPSPDGSRAAAHARGGREDFGNTTNMVRRMTTQERRVYRKNVQRCWLTGLTARRRRWFRPQQPVAQAPFFFF